MTWLIPRSSERLFGVSGDTVRTPSIVHKRGRTRKNVSGLSEPAFRVGSARDLPFPPPLSLYLGYLGGTDARASRLRAASHTPCPSRIAARTFSRWLGGTLATEPNAAPWHEAGGDASSRR